MAPTDPHSVAVPPPHGTSSQPIPPLGAGCTNPLPGEGLPGSVLLPVATASAAPTPGASPRRGAFGATPKPLVHNGVEYPSQSALAKATGLHRATVSAAYRRGRLAWLGCGSTASGQARVAQAARRQPCAAHGWFWESQKEAAAAIGMSESGIYCALRRGDFENLVLRRLGVKP